MVHVLKILIIFFVCATCVSAKGKRRKKQAPQNNEAPTSMPTAAFLASCRQYQDTDASVEAVFDNGKETQRAFITDFVDVVSESPDVASVEDGNKIIGNSLGSSVISVALPVEIPVMSDSVTVSSDPVKLVDLQVTAITDAKPSDAVTYGDIFDGGTAEFELKQLLQFDGMSAGISVFANFSDGMHSDVTSKSYVKSLSPNLIQSDDAFGPLITVDEYSRTQSGQLIEASFPICVRNTNVTNTGYVELDIEPVEVIFYPQFPVLCNKHDLAADYPFSLPDRTFFFVSILFKGGYVRNFTDDMNLGLNPRAHIFLRNGTDRVEIQSENYLQLTETASNGTIALDVTFPGLYNITAMTTVLIVQYQGTSVTATTFPANPGIIKNTIYTLDCSGRQQRLQILALGILSNNVLKDVTFDARFHINDPDSPVGSMYKVKNYTMFEGYTEGTLFIAAQYGSFLSVWSPLHVLPGVETAVVRIDSYGAAPNNTMRGFANSVWRFLSVQVDFDDGTYYPEIIDGVTNEWVNASQLVVFNASNDAIQVDQSANVTLKKNYYLKIFIEVIRRCDTSENPVMDDSFVYTNLKPVKYDFDMGSTVGPKFGTVLVDAPFQVPIGVQSKPTEPITTFHMVLKFDPEVVSVDDDESGCLMDPSWTGFFECTTNNPPGEVHIAGICGMQGCESEDFVKFANIAFTTNGIGKSLITGAIVRAGDTAETVSNLTIVAGSDDVLLQTATPSSQPTGEPSGQPTSAPSTVPSVNPTSTPTGSPTPAPTHKPTRLPTPRPSAVPTLQPTHVPTVRPTFTVTARPTVRPTARPTMQPTAVPSRKPSKQPTARPTREPSIQPTRKPTKVPTAQPTRDPTSAKPSKAPTIRPTMKPTAEPTTGRPSRQPTAVPTEYPTYRPTFEPTEEPTHVPTREPTEYPTLRPTLEPTPLPSVTPTRKPTKVPTFRPSFRPSAHPTVKPTRLPTTWKPTRVPTFQPTSRKPTAKPTKMPTVVPTTATPTTARPTTSYPSSMPTVVPTSIPTGSPTSIPTVTPTVVPTSYPTSIPTCYPTAHPTPKPTRKPSAVPTARPIVNPTFRPTRFKSARPTVGTPTSGPTSVPTSGYPTSIPSVVPTVVPTSSPSECPTSRPSPVPTSIPTAIPTCNPTSIPSSMPTIAPSERPTSVPTTSLPTSMPSSMPTVYVHTGYNFSASSGGMAFGSITTALRGTEEICSDLPANGEIPVILSDLKATAQDPDYIVRYAITITNPLGLQSVRFGSEDVALSTAGHPALSRTTVYAPFKYWDIAYNFGSTGETLKGTLEGDAVLSGIGLFKVCLVNLDPTEAFVEVNYTGTVVFHKTVYDSGIPLSGFVYFESPTFAPTRQPSLSSPTSVPTSAPSFGTQKDGINFLSFCDEMVYGEVIIRDLPYMREGCGYFAGTGVGSMVEVELYFQELFEGDSPVHVVIQDLTNHIAYRYGDSYVDISGAEDVSDLSKGADFIHFADGVDVGYMKSRKIAMPREGYEALSGTGWFAVCLINTGHDTNDVNVMANEFVVAGGISFLDFTVDCFVMFTQPLVQPTRRDLLEDAGFSSSAEYNSASPGTLQLSSSNNARQRHTHAMDLKGHMEGGDTAPLIAHIQRTADLFRNESYHIPAKQNSLHVLQELEEDDMELLYANPVSTTFEFAPRTQSFVVPDGTTTITVSACGGSGGGTARAAGGLGGCIKTIISVVPKQTLFITVGGEGQSHGVSGFHGGGIGSSATLGVASESNSAGGAGGGGASEVRFNDSDLSSRLVVAGGGGGGGSVAGALGGVGGGLVGGAGDKGLLSIVGSVVPSVGGSQSSGGGGGMHEGSSCGTNDGYLGSGGASLLGGGGGGGYYGGGGGCYSGGGGGSNYAVGSVVGNIQGAHSGPGFVRLTYNKRRRVREVYLPPPQQREFRMLNNGAAGVGTTDDAYDVVECLDCILGDVNKDCVFDAQDARELQQIVAFNLVEEQSSTYTTCQLVQMDPNRDGYINVLDVLFLMRVATKKYRFLHMLEVQYNIELGLMIEADVRDSNGEMFDTEYASVSLSLATWQGPDLELVSGVLEPAVQYPWGVQITPAHMPDTGLVRMHSSHIYNENGIAIAVIIRTYDDRGRTQGDREYTFYCSPYNNPNSMCLSSHTRADFDGYFEFDVTGMPTWQPTVQPTWSMSPTSSPTPNPTTGTPTSYPTLHFVDVDKYVTLIHPVIETSGGFALPTHSYPALIGKSRWTLPFSMFASSEPNQQTSFGVTIAGRLYSSTSVTYGRRPIASISLIVKTPRVYNADARLVTVGYQVRDARGDTAVEFGAEVDLLLDAARGSTIFTCSAPDPVSGIGDCRGSLPNDWWGANISMVDLVLRVAALGVEAVGSLELVGVTFGRPSNTQDPFMMMTVATRPLSPGEQFTSSIICDTDGKTLKEWTISIEYNPSLVEFVSFKVGNGYRKPFPIQNQISSELAVLRMASKSRHKKNNNLKGNNIDMVEITWAVLTDAGEGVHDAMRAELVSCRDVRLERNSYMFVQDHRNYNDFTTAQLHVLSLSTVPSGVFAFANHTELLNTASIAAGGDPVLSGITVMGFVPGTGAETTEITASCYCTAREDSMAVLTMMNVPNSPCVVSLSSSATAGSAVAIVDVICPQGSTTVPFRVWYAHSVKVAALDNVLNVIYPAHAGVL